jgi:serine/threonine-protein kinase RsbW
MTHAERVALVVPAKGEYARTVRLAAAELAARAGMDIDGIDDVRMAVEEAFVFAVARVSGVNLEFTFDVAPGFIELSVGPLLSGSEDADDPDRGERYARFILETICDEFELVENEVGCTLRLVKRAV